MIDTDKYEGHSEDEWILVDDKYIIMKNKTGNVAKFDTRYKTGVKVSQPDMDLIQDAPKLLAEVKRLGEQNTLLASQVRLAYEWVEAFHNEGTMISFIEHVYGDEEG